MKGLKFVDIFIKIYREVCSNFGDTALTSSFTKYKIFGDEKYFCKNCEWIVSFEIVLAFEW